MNIRDLVIFDRVAEVGTISGAAKKLNYVQSNVSSRIQKLEEDLNVPLFHRSKRGMKLTPEGKALRSYAQEIITLSRAMKAFSTQANTPRGRLEIASVETVIKLPLILSKFNKWYQEVDLTLSTGVTAELRDKVINYQLDGAFVTKNALTSHPDLIEAKVFSEQLVLIADRPYQALEVLMQQPLLIFSDGCGYRAKLTEWLRDSGIRPTKQMELGTLETTLGSVISGLGVAYVPYSAVQHYEASGLIHCHELPEKYSAIETVFIYREKDYLTPALEKFVETIELTRHDAISPFYRLD